jgi:hypothetical protein
VRPNTNVPGEKQRHGRKIHAVISPAHSIIIESFIQKITSSASLFSASQRRSANSSSGNFHTFGYDISQEGESLSGFKVLLREDLYRNIFSCFEQCIMLFDFNRIGIHEVYSFCAKSNISLIPRGCRISAIQFFLSRYL